MFNTVIVATDLTAGPDRAVRFARTLATRGGLALELLTVVPPEDRVHADRRGESWARSVGARFTVAVDDDVAGAILEHVRGREGALLVMGTGGAGLVSGVRRSITSDLLGSVPRPVLLLGPAVPNDVSLSAPTLVAGIDRTHEDFPALSVITSWQRTFGGQPPRIVDVVPTSGWPADAVDQSAEDRAVAAVIEALVGEGIEATGAVLHGADPVPTLLEFADAMDDPVFLMTSDRWAGGRSHWYSTARRLVQLSERPTLIVPSDFSG